MNTQDYINELKIHLHKLQDDDREDAISYYFEYLAEAGPDGAAEAMDKLGTPAELAAGIRADQAMQDFEDLDGPGGAAVGKGVQAVWLAGLAAVPRNALAGLVTGIIIVVFFAVMIALFAAAVAAMGAGAIGLGSGIWLLHVQASAALFYFGSGLALIGGGVLLFGFAVWSSKHLLLAIADVFNGIRHKRERKLDPMRAEMLDRRYEERRIRKREKRAYKSERKLVRKRDKAERRRDKAERKRVKIDRKIERKREKLDRKIDRRLEKRLGAAGAVPMPAVEPEAALAPMPAVEPETAAEIETAAAPEALPEPEAAAEPEAAPETETVQDSKEDLKS